MVDLAFLYVLTDIVGVWYMISVGLAFLAAYFVSFSLQKFWTFRDSGREKIYRQMSLYFIVGVANLFLNAAGMYSLVEYFSTQYLLAQIIVGAVLGLGNLGIYRFIIFEKKRIGAKTKKRVLIISGAFPPEIGGPASLLANLVPSLLEKGYEITVLTYGDVQDDLPYRVVRISLAQKKFFRIFRLVKNAIFLSFRNDQIYALDTYWPGFSAWIASKISGRRLVARFTGDVAWETASNLNLTRDDIVTFQKKFINLKISVLKWCRNRILKSCQAVITDCFFLKNLLESFGVKKDRIMVVHNSVEYLARPTGFSADVFRKNNNLKGKVIVTVGRLVPWKGLEKILEILPELNKEFSGISLIIIGEGPELENLKEKAGQLKKEPNLDVRFLGRLPRAEVIPWYLSADAYVLNSNYEGIAHTLVEALYFGAPIVATNAGGTPEIITNEYNGLVFKYNQEDEMKACLRRVLSDNNLVEKLKNNAKEKLANDFVWEKVVEAHLEALKI